MTEVKCSKCGYIFYKPEGMVSVDCPQCGSTDIIETKK